MKYLFTIWSFDAASVIMLSLMMAICLLLKNFKAKRFFLFAIITCIICFFSPLHVLSSHYLFSAHMVVHVILLLVVGPLLVLSLPPHKNDFSSFFLFLKQHPVLGWLTGVGMMWFWHVPVLFNSVMAVSHQSSFSVYPVSEAISLIVAGILFSAPVIHSNRNFRIDGLSGVVYLFTACIGCSILGLLITFAPAGTYHHFLSKHDVYNLNNVIIKQWGITQSTDQQAAGLIMWVPCCLIYVISAMYLLLKWLKQKDETIIQLNKG